MRIKIVAYLNAPSLLQWRGSPNSTIFTGIFKKEISVKDRNNLKCGDKIKCKGIEIFIRRIEKGKTFICDGQLSSVSIIYFRKLKKAGWKIDSRSASQYGFPCNDQDEKLKEYIRIKQEELKRHLRTKKLFKRKFKKIIKEIEKDMFPFKNFPQVH